ncbi:uncharacterized protein LOC135226193 [Macrobrachium nipponense]|uniref:uncharacterized protein LOC135226193 n=1 Tax=Macrobrachium nipponense TaxID=159736 RepID=UPI0030C88AFC
MDNHLRCKAMFTLSDINQRQWMLRHLLDDPNWYLTAELLHNVSVQMEKMMTMRADGVGPSTQDYTELGHFVPNLFHFTEPMSQASDIHFDSDSKSPNIKQNLLLNPNLNLSLHKNIYNDFDAHHLTQNDSGSADGHQSLPAAKVVSYLQSSKGIFPFIPCRIRQHTQENVLTCLNRRLKETNNMTIFFLGDSKVRNIYSTLLNMTSYLKYNISFANKTVPLENLWQEYSKKEFKHGDFDAISSIYPNFRVVIRFRLFWDMANLHTSQEVILLKEWASGQRPVPDLLIVGIPMTWEDLFLHHECLDGNSLLILELAFGYTTWMLSFHLMRKDYKTSVPLDIVHLLYNLHKVIVPLLKDVSLKTTVLVHADTRLRTFGKFPGQRGFWQNNVILHDSLIDWSEVIFWHFLKNSKDYHKKMDHMSYVNFQSSKVLHEFLDGNKFLSLQSHFTSANQTNEPASSNSYVKARMGHDGQPHRADPKDHLRRFGLWWWDTTLVLNMATISQCKKLYELNLQNHPLYKSQQLRCYDPNHAGNSTNEVEVQMILSLICNSVVTTREEYCCS